MTPTSPNSTASERALDVCCDIECACDQLHDDRWSEAEKRITIEIFAAEKAAYEAGAKAMRRGSENACIVYGRNFPYARVASERMAEEIRALPIPPRPDDE